MFDAGRAAGVIACILACAVPASAQSPVAAATIQFDQGRAFMRQGKFKQACEAFEKSQKLDPQNGTLFNLAECSARLGKLATAWLAYRDLGQRDTLAARKQEANKRAKELVKRLPKLVVKIESPPAGLALTINGTDSTSLVGIESPVDLGDYEIRATAPGFADFETSETVSAEGKTVTVEVELEPANAPVKKPKKAKKTKAEPLEEPGGPTSHRKRNGAIVGSIGGVAMATGLVFGLRARSQWNDAQALCPDRTCPNPADQQRGDDLVDAATANATRATAFFVGGAVVTAIGVYLVVTAKPSGTTTALQIAPTSGGAAVVLGGRF